MPSTPPGGDPASADALRALPLRAAPIAVLDLEMTGLSPAGDRICEVAVVAGSHGAVERELQTLVCPGMPLTQGARDSTGLTDALLIGAPVFAEVAGAVVSSLSGRILVAHNVDFDLGFLHRALDGTPTVLAPPVTLDTLLMARRLFAFRSNRLVDVCKRLDIVQETSHRALSDARAAFAVFERMVDLVDPEGAFTVGDLADLLGALAPNSPERLLHQQILRDAFRLGRSVWLDYQSTTDPVEGRVAREVDLWFLRLPRFHGWCHLRQAERVFTAERIRSVRLGDREVAVPPRAVSRL